MSENRLTLHAVAWSEVFPWLLLLRVFRLATSMPMLFLATVGVLVMPVGWRLADLCLPERGAPVAAATEVAARQAWPGQPAGWEYVTSDPGLLPAPGVRWTAPLQQVFVDAVRPFAELLRQETSWAGLAYYAVGGLWTLLVWALFGGAINRSAMVQLGRQEREGAFEALGFAARRWRSYFAAPLFPLLGVAVVVVFALPVGWLMRWDGGALAASLLWPFVLLGGLFAAALLLGLLFGWPLMWGAISAEEMGDVFEGNQRSFSYTFGRPLHYLCYAVVALLLGSAGFFVVRIFAEGLVTISYWAVSWGAGSERLADLAASNAGPVLAGQVIMDGLNGLVLTVASAFRYSFFWCAAAAIYLLLRRDADRTEFDDVYVVDEVERYGLSALTEDGQAADQEAVPPATPDAE